MSLFLIVSSDVAGALAVVLASMVHLLSWPSFRLQYLLDYDILDKGEGRFFEPMLSHKIPDLSFDVGHAGDMVECYVLPGSFFADIDLHDE